MLEPTIRDVVHPHSVIGHGDEFPRRLGTGPRQTSGQGLTWAMQQEAEAYPATDTSMPIGLSGWFS